MAVMEKSQLLAFLQAQSQQQWLDALDVIGPDQHEVDREATRVWFAFWPLDLHEALSSAADEDDESEMARLMDLEGSWRIEDQADASVSFLYGARFWPAVKRAIVGDSGRYDSVESAVRAVASEVSREEEVELALTLGISAVGLMVLRLLGESELEKRVDTPAEGPLLSGSPDRIVARRKRESRDGVLTFLKGVNRRWEVRWDERKSDRVFRAYNGQDLAMGASREEGDFRELDYRRIEGPLPVECRVGSCGYCWVGVLAGRDKLSEITPFERERLAYFGYDTVNAQNDPRPPIRLACQAACSGDVTLAVPPWNGELNRRHDKGRDELGTA